MKNDWIACAWLALAAGAVCAAGAAPGSIVGVIRDENNKPVAGAHVVVTCGTGGSQDAQTTSDATGLYRVEGIGFQDCKVGVERPGFLPLDGKSVSLTPGAAAATLDFTLKSAAPRFQAAGVRGLIDPGGYSAPANAAAASGLIEGIADIRRADAGPGVFKAALPCAFEPELTKAVEAAPNGPEPNLKLAEFYLAHDRPAMALPFFERTRQIEPGNYGASRGLAEAWIRAGHFDSARTLLNALAARRSEPEIHALLARAEEGLGMFTQASKEYRLASKIDPSEENLFGAGYELILSGAPVDAAQVFDAGLEKYPASIRLLIGRGTSEFLMGRGSQAVLTLLGAVERNPSDSRPYDFLVKAFSVSGVESERVRASLKRFVALAPGNAVANYLYALTLQHGSRRERDDDAGTVETLLKKAVELDPNLADAHFELAARCAARDDLECAIRHYEAAARLRPDRPETLYRLAMAYGKAGKKELAAAELESFQQVRASRKTETGGLNGSIEQFISVFHGGGENRSSVLPCPGWSQ